MKVPAKKNTFAEVKFAQKLRKVKAAEGNNIIERAARDDKNLYAIVAFSLKCMMFRALLQNFTEESTESESEFWQSELHEVVNWLFSPFVQLLKLLLKIQKN